MIIWVGLGFLGLFLVPLVVGSLLPERFTGRTKVFLPRSQVDVWTALADFSSHPMTGQMMKAVANIEDHEGAPTWTEDMGRGEVIRVRTVESDEPRSMTRNMESTKLPMTSRWMYLLESVEGGCNVSIEGETIIRRGPILVPIFKFMMLVGGGVKKGLDIQLDMVAKTLQVESRPA